MLNAIKSVEKMNIRQKFFNKHMDEYAKKKVEFKEDNESFEKWYNAAFKEFIKEWGYEDMFIDEYPEVEVVEEMSAPLLLDPPKVIDVENYQVDNTFNSMRSVVNQVADSLASEGIIDKNPIKKGLIFDHLVVKDPEKAAAVDNGMHTIKVEDGPVTITMFDNSQIISKFPDMGRIQDIIRITEGWDVEMLLLYGEFIVCTLYINGAVTNKVFIVDYKGRFMNNIPKIFLIKGGYIDESEAIHLDDAPNLINYLKGIPITPSSEEIVTPVQRRISRYIVNYGTPKVGESFKNEFESICIDKIIPFIETQIIPTHPDAAFAIVNFEDQTHWEMECTNSIPYRFGEVGSICRSNICIHAEGLDKDGKLIVTSHSL